MAFIYHITCQLVSEMRLAGLHLPHHLPARDCSETRRTASAASLDCICQFLIAVGLAGLFAPRKTLWASPDFLRLEGFAGLFAPAKLPWASPNFLRQKDCQKECKICQMDSQIKCQSLNAR